MKKQTLYYFYLLVALMKAFDSYAEEKKRATH